MKQQTHIFIIIGIIAIFAIWYISKQAKSSLSNSITEQPISAPDSPTSTAALFEEQ